MVWLFCCLVGCLFAWFIVWQLDCWVVWLLSLRSLPVVSGLYSFVFLFGLWALPFRRRPFDVWLLSCLVVWLFGCLMGNIDPSVLESRNDIIGAQHVAGTKYIAGKQRIDRALCGRCLELVCGRCLQLV